MKNRCFLLVIFSIFSLSSCSSVPQPMSHQYSTQIKLEAAEHWEIVAQDFAKQIVQSMMENPYLVSGKSGSGISGVKYIDPEGSGDDVSAIPPIYVQNNDLSDFGKTFRSYLVTELSKLGYPIANTPKDAVIARWSVNKVYHNADRMASGWPATWTTAALIGSGVYKLIDDSGSAFAGVLAGGIALDIINSAGKQLVPSYVPHTEIVLTFTAAKDETIISRQSQAYYVNDLDVNHYNCIADYAGRESNLKPIRFSVTN